MQVKSVYRFSPLVALSSVPVLCNVPGLGCPAVFTFTAVRPIEHPGGFESAPLKGVATVTPFQRTGNAANPGAIPPGSAITWRTPSIYQQITIAGETIISQAVVLVTANDTQWTSGGLPPIQAGDGVWLDTQATGNWKVSKGKVIVDANGLSTSLASNGFPMCALVGRIYNGTKPQSLPFVLGVNAVNYPPPGGATGTLYLAANGNGSEGKNLSNKPVPGSGSVMVRVILTH